MSSAIFAFTSYSLDHNVVFVSRDSFVPSLSRQKYLALETIWLAQERIKIQLKRTFEEEKDQVTTTQNALVLSTVHALARRQNHLIRSKCLQGLLEVNSCRRYSCFITTLNLSELVSSGWQPSKTSPLVGVLNVMEYYRARKTLLNHISKHRGESWKYYAWRSIFDELRASS